jgi:hypothetical protein
MDMTTAIQALRDRGRRMVSLDTPADADLGDVAVDIGAGFVPGVGTALSARDFERARREGDTLGMVLGAAGMVPVAGGAARAASKALRKAPRDEALETARINAVKMLGLPENNTAMDRARAMGFDTPAFHGTDTDFQIPVRDVFASLAPSVANRYAFKNGDESGMVIPLMVQSDRPAFEHLGAQSYRLDPSSVRSRFAAFDPARINENDLLGRADPRLLAMIAGGGLTGLTVNALRNKRNEEKKEEEKQ